MVQSILWILVFSMTVHDSWMTTRECDVAISGPAGVLQFTDSYQDLKSWTFHCEYNITTRESSNILVTLSSPSENSSANACGNSYIVLKDGFEQSSPLLGPDKYCGDSQVGPLSTSGNQLNIRTVIQFGIGTHYTLKYQEASLMCGGIFEVASNTSHQAIESPKAFSSSPSECVWIFVAPADHSLSMNFTQFNSLPATNCQEEYVEVRNGGTSASSIISQACSKDEEEINTSGNLLYVKFHSNSAKPSISFQAEITVVKQKCGGTLRVDNGAIISPNYPYHKPNEPCTWKIIAPSKKRIIFQFHDLHLPDTLNCQENNYLKISHKIPENGTNAILGTFCGSNKPNIVKTLCNRATIELRSDYHQIGNFRGFVLNFTTTDEPCVINCGGILTSDNGIISSPNFPDDYEPNQNCEWKINVSPKKKIKFQFFRLMIDDSPQCSDDYLLIKEMINGTDNNLGLYCNDSNPMPITTSGSMAKVMFHSNDKYEDSGFLLTYTAVEKSHYNEKSKDSEILLTRTGNEQSSLCNITCEQVFRRSNGIITPPKFPDDCPAVTCIYRIIQPAGEIIKLRVSNLLPNSKTDELEIWDSNEEDNLVTDLNHDSTEWLFDSSTNYLTLKFLSKWPRPDGKRFAAVYQTLEKGCGGLLTAASGTIQTPNYPSTYPNEAYCLWIIKAPPNRTISLTWSAFRTREYSDFAVISEKDENGLYYNIGRYSLSQMPFPVVTSRNVLKVTFQSDGNAVETGFSANYIFN